MRFVVVWFFVAACVNAFIENEITIKTRLDQEQVKSVFTSLINHPQRKFVFRLLRQVGQRILGFIVSGCSS